MVPDQASQSNLYGKKEESKNKRALRAAWAELVTSINPDHMVAPYRRRFDQATPYAWLAESTPEPWAGDAACMYGAGYPRGVPDTSFIGCRPGKWGDWIEARDACIRVRDDQAIYLPWRKGGCGLSSVGDRRSTVSTRPCAGHSYHGNQMHPVVVEQLDGWAD